MSAICTGSIGFGLVKIPVKIFSATTEVRPDFDILDRKGHSSIRYKRINEKTGKRPTIRKFKLQKEPSEDLLEQLKASLA